MKIAIVTSFPRDPDAPQGGVQVVSVNLVKALAKLPAAEVHVVTTDNELESTTETVWENAIIHRLPATGRNLLVYAVGKGSRQVQEFLQKLNPDVVHAHDFYGIMVKGLALPRVFTIHGFIHEDTLYDRKRMAWLRAVIWKKVEIASWREQPHIVSISPYVRERLRGIARGVINDIENPIAEDSFSIQSTLQSALIFSAATICKRKNTLGLLEAFHRLIRSGCRAQLRLAGKPTEPEYERQVKNFILENSLSGHVTLLGSLSSAQVRDELVAASVFALLSFEEGAPMGVAEAMAAGLPIVTSNRCGMPYMVKHGESGFLVDPTNPDDAAQCFHRLLNVDALRKRLGENGKQTSLANFHPGRIAEKTFAVYQSAINAFQGWPLFSLPKN